MTSEDPLVLRSDRADGLTTLTLNRPGQFNSLSKEMLTALQARLDAIAAGEAGACRRHRWRRQGFLRRPRPQGNARQPRQGFMQALFRQCGRTDADPHPHAAAGHRPRARHRHRGRLPAGRRCATSRSPPTSPNSPSPASMSACSARRPPWPRPQHGPQAGPGNAAHRRLHRRPGSAGQGPGQSRRARRRTGRRDRAAGAVDRRQVAVAVRIGKRMFYRQLEMGLDAAYHSPARPWPAT